MVGVRFGADGAMALVAGWLRIPFWQRVLAGFVLGAFAGWLLGPAAETGSSRWAMSTST
jgi:membrane protein YqaA with SNARE-associated domain